MKGEAIHKKSKLKYLLFNLFENILSAKKWPKLGTPNKNTLEIFTNTEGQKYLKINNNKNWWTIPLRNSSISKGQTLKPRGNDWHSELYETGFPLMVVKLTAPRNSAQTGVEHASCLQQWWISWLKGELTKYIYIFFKYGWTPCIHSMDLSNFCLEPLVQRYAHFQTGKVCFLCKHLKMALTLDLGAPIQKGLQTPYHINV